MPMMNLQCSKSLDKMGIPRRLHNKGNNMNNESTYTLLVRSEDKSRSILEVGVFGLIALSALLAFFQFARQTESLPLPGGHRAAGDWPNTLVKLGLFDNE